MSVTYGFFNSVAGDRKYNAEQMTDFYTGICSQGVFQSVDNGLQVVAGTGMTVKVKTGRAIIQNKWVKNDAELTLNITAASSTLPRITAVIIKLNDNNRTITITTKDGEYASSPVAPSMTRADGIYEMALAYVNVSASATSVTVTDKRSDTGVCGWAAVAQAIDGTYEALIDDIKTGFDGVVYNTPGDAVRTCDQKLQTQINAINRTTTYNATQADNYWIAFPVSNGGKVKISNTGANRITAIGPTSAIYGDRIQNFGDLNAGASAVYTCTVANANYIRFWATGATTVVFEDYDAIIPTIEKDIQDLSDEVDANTNSISNIISDVKVGNVNTYNSFDCIDISSAKSYFKVPSVNGSNVLRQTSPLSLTSGSTISSIEIYKNYALSEIGNGKTLSVGSKTSALYGTTAPSDSVWNAILFKSADYNGEIYNGVTADYLVQYNGDKIQVMHVRPGMSSELYKQSAYGNIIRLDKPMEVMQVNSSAINVFNAIPSSAADVVLADVNNTELTYITTDDIVWAKGSTSLYFKRYVDIFGRTSANRCKIIGGYFSNGVVKGDQVGFISVYDVRQSLSAYIYGYVFNTHDYYDLLDSDFNVISYVNNNSGSYKEIGNYYVDVSNASYICVSNNNNSSTV